MTAASDRSAGFTLIELLVATTLLALLSVLLFGGLRFGARAWEAGGASMERTGEIEAIQDLLRRTLAEAAAPEPASGQQLSFVGDAGRMRFFAPMPRHIAMRRTSDVMTTCSSGPRPSDPVTAGASRSRVMTV